MFKANVATFTQEALRIGFYAITVYTIYLVLSLVMKKRKTFKKGMQDYVAYMIISALLIIILGNIIIFNVDMYDTILGPMEAHTTVYLLLIIGGFSAVFFLHRAVKES